jgi:hypothetical protein
MNHGLGRVLVVSALLGVAVASHARAQPEPPMPPPERLTPAEIVRLFDAYVVVQAQEQLGLDTDQYGTFVANYKRVVDARRRHQEARLRILTELGVLVRRASAGTDEARIKERLEALSAQDAGGAAEVRKAQEAVEQGLTTLQRARFRLFEEQMERRKFDLLSRARQTIRQGRRPPQRD